MNYSEIAGLVVLDTEGVPLPSKDVYRNVSQVILCISGELEVINYRLTKLGETVQCMFVLWWS